MALAERRIRVLGVGGTPGEGFVGLEAIRRTLAARDEEANLARVAG